jgi:hypothetical protein
MGLQKEICMTKTDTATPLRLLVGVLVALLLGAVLVDGPTSAYADDGPVITVGSTGEVVPGQVFTVPVDIKGNPGFAACSLELRYDKTALELISLDAPELTGGNVIKNIEGNTFGYLALNNVTGDGVLFEATFKVHDNAAIGSYGVAVALKDNSDENLVNANGTPLGARFTTGSVQVSAVKDSGAQDTDSGVPEDKAVPQPTPEFVNAANPNGIALRLGLRGQEGNLDYSLDGGGTWDKLPADGIITTIDGERISVYGEGDADYYVSDLPESMLPKAAFGQDVSPLTWVIIVLVIVVAFVIVLRLVPRRRQSLTADSFDKEL